MAIKIGNIEDLNNAGPSAGPIKIGNIEDLDKPDDSGPSNIKQTLTKKVWKPSGNVLIGALEQLNRPQYAVANVIYNALEKNDYNVAKNAWKGLTLEEKKSMQNVLQDEFGVPKTKLGKAGMFALGLAGDIATDPLTYTGIGLAERGAKGVGELFKEGSKAKEAAEAMRYDVGSKAPSSRVLTASVPFGKKYIVPGSEQIIDPLSQALTKANNYIREESFLADPISGIARTFSTKMKPRGVSMTDWNYAIDSLNQANTTRQVIESEALQKAVQIAKQIREQKLSPEEASQLSHQVETKQTENLVNPDIVQGATDYSNQLSGKLNDLTMTNKKLINEEGYNYLPHVVNPAIKNQDKINLGLGQRLFSTKSKSDIARNWLKYTDKNGNEAIINASTGKIFSNGAEVGSLHNNWDDVATKLDPEYLKMGTPDENGLLLPNGDRLSNTSAHEINSQTGKQIFSTSLPTMIAVQGKRIGKVVSSDEFFKKIEPLGVAPKISKGKITNASELVTKDGRDMVQSTAPELKGKFFDPEIARHIDRVYNTLSNSDEINSFLRMTDNVTNFVKKTQTLWNLPFHTRNAVSNMLQNWYFDVKNPLDYAQAATLKLKDQLAQAGKEVPENLKLTPEDQKILSEYKSQGLGHVGFLSGDVNASIENQLKTLLQPVKEAEGIKDKSKAISVVPFNFLTKVGSETGQNIEDWARLTHFIAKRKAGLDPEEAAQSVKKALFDYGDLTQVEKGVMKRLIPYYAWMRKNIPLQVEAYLTKPDKLATLVKAKNNVEIVQGPPDKAYDILPDYLKNSAPIYIGKVGNKHRYVSMQGYVPASDLAKLNPLDAVREMMIDINPIIQKPIEFSLNHQFYFDQPITRQKGYASLIPNTPLTPGGGYGEREVLRQDVPGRLAYLATFWRPVNEINKVVGSKYKEDPTMIAKIMNIGLGGKVTEVDIPEALRKYKRLNEQDVANISAQIKYMRSKRKQNPGNRENFDNSIRTLVEIRRKLNQDARSKTRAAREEILSEPQ